MKNLLKLIVFIVFVILLGNLILINIQPNKHIDIMLDPITCYTLIQNDLTLILNNSLVLNKIMKILNITYPLYKYKPFFFCILKSLRFNFETKSYGFQIEITDFQDMYDDFKQSKRLYVQELLMNKISRNEFDTSTTENFLKVLRKHQLSSLFLYKYLSNLISSKPQT